jgi:hypothetical protein
VLSFDSRDSRCVSMMVMVGRVFRPLRRQRTAFLNV